MIKVYKLIKQKLNDKFSIIIDNFIAHKTEQLYKFYIKKKNLIFFLYTILQIF